MKLASMIFVGVMFMFALGCDHKPGLTARESGDGGAAPGKTDPQKPTDPGSDAKKVEKMGLLQFQPETQVEDDFANVLRLPLNGEDQAWFSFIYDAKVDGSFFFLTSQAALRSDCKFSDSFKYDVVWQEYDGKKRTVLQLFTPNITEYNFKANKRYILSYVLQDLKKDFPGCKSATVKFALLPKIF